MVRPDTVCKSIVRALKESERLPDETTYSVYEIDADGGQSNLRPPIVEVTTTGAMVYDEHNTDLVDYATDGSDNAIGYIYESEFEMPIAIDLWTAEGGHYDPYELGEAVRYALYRYDDKHVGDPLPDPDDPSVPQDEITQFFMGDGNVRNDLSMTPALRRWRQDGTVWFYETINTAEEYGALPYVASIVGPNEDDVLQ